MARKKAEPEKKTFDNPKVVGLHSEVLEQPITQTLETNWNKEQLSIVAFVYNDSGVQQAAKFKVTTP